jgi:hypothetical protein
LFGGFWMFEPIFTTPADAIAGGRPAASASSFFTDETIDSVDGCGPPDAAGAAPSSFPQATSVDRTRAVTASLRISTAPPGVVAKSYNSLLKMSTAS